MTVPSVQCLRVGISEEDLPNFVSFQARSSCCITALEASVHLQHPNWAPFMSSLHHLVDLKIVLSGPGDVIMDEFLALPHCRTGYLPLLAKFDGYSGASRSFDKHLLCDVLESRAAAGTCLTSFRLGIRGGSEIRQETEQRLSGLQGMAISICSNKYKPPVQSGD